MLSLLQPVRIFVFHPSLVITTMEEDLHDKLISAWELQRYRAGPGQPDLPPQLSDMAEKTTDDIMKELNRLPFFMTELDELDGLGGDNAHLEALKSLAYEGEPHEIATNFKNQGNDAYKAKQYKTAVQYYTQGLEVECDDAKINTALYANRAACNLELKNYRRCIEDCKLVLKLDAHNVKACYRAGKAFFLVDRFEEARGILEYGLSIDKDNAAINDTLAQISAKEAALLAAKQLKERAEKEKEMKHTILSNAIQLRHIETVRSSRPVELLEGAKIRLEDEVDHELQLIFPAMVLYPTTDEFDYVAEVSELLTPNDILDIVLARPDAWFAEEKHRAFAGRKVDCYMETVSGGLVKVGRKMAVNQALMSDKLKAPLFDNGLRMYVVPKVDSEKWLKTWSKETALKKREESK